MEQKRTSFETVFDFYTRNNNLTVEIIKKIMQSELSITLQPSMELFVRYYSNDTD